MIAAMVSVSLTVVGCAMQTRSLHDFSANAQSVEPSLRKRVKLLEQLLAHAQQAALLPADRIVEGDAAASDSAYALPLQASGLSAESAHDPLPTTGDAAPDTGMCRSFSNMFLLEL